jgi:hypothetical protein
VLLIQSTRIADGGIEQLAEVVARLVAGEEWPD